MRRRAHAGEAKSNQLLGAIPLSFSLGVMTSRQFFFTTLSQEVARFDAVGSKVSFVPIDRIENRVVDEGE